eukprot:GILI01019115.1.p1 GENE.GILI01019115.1~~GILI01019115.1.p1  ORF type:complete len:138 (+),score=8.52 GILI01019115.1:71-484(+)
MNTGDDAAAETTVSETTVGGEVLVDCSKLKGNAKASAVRKNNIIRRRQKRERDRADTEQKNIITDLAGTETTKSNDDYKLPWIAQPLAVRILIGHLQLKHGETAAIAKLFGKSMQSIRNDADNYHKNVAMFKNHETQ